jgi:YggT family protein
MDIILIPFLRLMIQVISLYKLMLVIYIILGWLEAFNVVNRYNQLIYGTHNFLFRIIEPVLTPIRRIMPNFGGFDLSAIVLFFGLYFVNDILHQLILKFPS